MQQVFNKTGSAVAPVIKPGTKILFANVPADGHFNPLTGLAVYLQEMGCDVRWYSSAQYADKIKSLQIPYYPFKKAVDWSGEKLDIVFPDRAKHTSQIGRLNFDIINAFILRATEYYADISEIYASFQYEMVIADVCFSAIPFIKDKMGIPVIAIGILPLSETSKDLPPAGLGLTPSGNWLGRRKDALLRFIANRVIFRKPNQVMKNLLIQHDIDPGNHCVFDLLIKKSTLVLQSGTPGFEYDRTDMSDNIRYIGALLPWTKKKHYPVWTNRKLSQYRKVIVVTQGTVERDVEKIIVPALEAFKNTEFLVIATTGGSKTKELRTRYSQENIIIEDFIPFEDIMPYACVYITNGGYGGVMLGIKNQLPLVVGGVHEGKIEINARVGYFKIGINLKTEKPTPAAVRHAVEKVLNDFNYRRNVRALSYEFSHYRTLELCAAYIAAAIQPKAAEISMLNKSIAV
jgi:UDP:flavonoid glycosyltransferase YjiC (YdhE family)